jgi:hypothetical protein
MDTARVSETQASTKQATRRLNPEEHYQKIFILLDSNLGTLKHIYIYMYIYVYVYSCNKNAKCVVTYKVALT